MKKAILGILLTGLISLSIAQRSAEERKPAPVNDPLTIPLTRTPAVKFRISYIGFDLDNKSMGVDVLFLDAADVIVEKKSVVWNAENYPEAAATAITTAVKTALKVKGVTN